MKTIHPSSPSKLLPGSLAVALIFCLVSPAAVRAATFRILDSSPDDSMLTIQVTGFQAFFVNGLEIAGGSGDVTLLDDSGIINFEGYWDSGNYVGDSNRTIWVLQSQDGPVGEKLFFNWNTDGEGAGAISGTFESDSPTHPDFGPVPGYVYQADIFIEGGQPIQFMNVNEGFVDAHLVTESVPEPGATSLVLAGLFGMAGGRRRANPA